MNHVLYLLIPSPQAYSEFRLPDYPALNTLITEHFQNQKADSRASLGPHFERPGRTVLENHLIAVPDADAVVPGAFEATERVYFTGVELWSQSRHYLLSDHRGLLSFFAKRYHTASDHPKKDGME